MTLLYMCDTPGTTYRFAAHEFMFIPRELR